MSTLTPEVLSKSSAARLEEVANYKYLQFLILTEDDETLGVKANAVLDSIEAHKFDPYTAAALFTINRTSQGVPYGAEAPARQYLQRTVYLRRIKAIELLEKFGIGDLLYLGLQEVPETTRGLASEFKKRFGFEVAPEDIVDQIIPVNSKCIILKFENQSIAFEGALRVDLTTQIYAPA